MPLKSIAGLLPRLTCPDGGPDNANVATGGLANPTSATPYQNLTPQAVLGALDTLGLYGDGRLIQLNSYENRVFQVFLEDGAMVVAKFYRPGRWSDAQILEEHAFSIELAEHDIPAVPPLVLDGATLHTFEGYRFSVAPQQSGRAPELEDESTLRWLGRLLGRLHARASLRPFEHRLTLSIQSHGIGPRNMLLASGWVAPDAQSSWQTVIDALLTQVQRCFDTMGDYAPLRLHGDCHAGNVLWHPTSGPHFVDLDDALMGPAVQDLWMLLPGDPAARAAPLAALLQGYENFMPFDRRELVLIEALRSLRMIHYSAWVANRYTDPAFVSAFPWFGTRAYWDDQTVRLQEQRVLLQTQGF